MKILKLLLKATKITTLFFVTMFSSCCCQIPVQPDLDDEDECYTFNEVSRTPSKQDRDSFRNYDNAPDHVKEFYRNNHKLQTIELVQQKRSEFFALQKARMTIWQAIELLDTIKDESDPDLIDRPQSYHAYQAAEAMRKDNQPDWFILTGFIHDLGKVLTHFGQPQWAVVGDTFPVGCAFSEKIIFYEYFKNNPDDQDNRYNSLYGIYQPNCGLDNVLMSWGHDEYLYQVLKNSKLPKQALFVIRYHSFYAAHKEGDYQHLMNEEDKKMLEWLKKFNQYDLYSKDINPPDIESIKPYYRALINEYLPGIFSW